MSSQTPTDVSSTDPDQQPHSTTPIAATDLFDALANERRQFVIRAVADGPTQISDLTAELACVETDTESAADLDYQQRRRVYIGLHQHHLDTLETADIVEWDEHSGRVSPGPTHDVAHRTLQFATGETPLPDRVRETVGGDDQ